MKRVNSHLGSKVAQHFCYLKLLTRPMCTRIRLKRYLCKYAHGSSSTPPTRPFTYLLTKLGTCTPTHENTPSARAQPDNKNMTIHTLRAGEKNAGMPSEKQPVREVHELCTSKNVRWFVGSSPSHLDFLQQTFDCD